MRSWNRLKKDPQWDHLQGELRAQSAHLVVVGLDPAGVTGWAIQELAVENVWHGQCPIAELGPWILPMLHGSQVLLAVERGYIPSLSPLAGASQRAVSERNVILLMERIGKVLGWAGASMALAGPIWRPTPNQWRSKFKGWVGSVKGRSEHKAKAVSLASHITGVEMRTQKHQTNNGRRIGRQSALEDEADAVCIMHAALHFYNSGAWPLWDEINYE